MADMPTLNCCYSSRRQVIRIKFYRTVVTGYILPPYQNLKQMNHWYLFKVNRHFTPMPCCYAVTTSNIGVYQHKTSNYSEILMLKCKKSEYGFKIDAVLASTAVKF